MLVQNMITKDGIREIDKVKVAIQRLKSFEPDNGYFLAFSGGKDSVVIKALADMAGVKYEAHYSLTSVDPPELVCFVKSFHDVVINYPKMSMFKLIEKKGIVPLRIARFCCAYLKEDGGAGKVVVTGVRWAESSNRKNNRNLIDIGGKKSGIVYNDDNDEARRMVENCYRTKKTLVNPIIDWTDQEVWEFIKKYKVRYCDLYDKGWKRLGCIGCPMVSPAERKREFELYPTYKKAYITAIRKIIAKRIEQGKPVKSTSAEQWFDDWVNDRPMSIQETNQIEMEEI